MPRETTCEEMRDDLSRIKTICRKLFMGELPPQQAAMAINKLAMKHAHGHYPAKEELDETYR